VIDVGTLRKLRCMVLHDGVSVREASPKLAISRNTANKWLAQGEMAEPKYPKLASPRSKLSGTKPAPLGTLPCSPCQRWH
jgi:transposase